MWKQISSSKFSKVKAVEVTKWFLFLRRCDIWGGPWRTGRSSENPQGLEKAFQAEATVCSKALRYMCGWCSLERSNGLNGRTGSYWGSLHHSQELRLYLIGILKPLEVDGMQVSSFWAVWPFCSVISPPGSVAKTNLLPTTSGSLLQKHTACWKTFCKVIRNDLTFYILGKILNLFMTLEIPMWPGVARVWGPGSQTQAERVWLILQSPCESRCPFSCSVSPSWFQIKHDCCNFYVLLPLLLHLSCRRNSWNLGQHWKICAGCPSLTSPWCLCFRKAGGREEDQPGEGPWEEGRPLLKPQLMITETWRKQRPWDQAGLESKCSQGRMATPLGLGF